MEEMISWNSETTAEFHPVTSSLAFFAACLSPMFATRQQDMLAGTQEKSQKTTVHRAARNPSLLFR